MTRSDALPLPTAPPAADGRATSAQGGDANAFVSAHFGFVWRSLLRLGLSHADAEDALQQVFITASRRRSDLEPGRERAFLFATAMRVVWHQRRARARRREVLEDAPAERPAGGPGADEQLDRARARAQLDAILDAMPLDLRAVFVLFELEQLTMAEIAPMLGVPPGTVASRLRRAREHFQGAVARLSARSAEDRGRGGKTSP